MILFAYKFRLVIKSVFLVIINGKYLLTLIYTKVTGYLIVIHLHNINYTIVNVITCLTLLLI